MYYRDCVVNGNNNSPKDSNFLGHGGYPKQPQLSPGSRPNHVMYNNEASGTQDWRHMNQHSSGKSKFLSLHFITLTDYIYNNVFVYFVVDK